MLSKSVWVWTLPFKKEVEFPAVFTKNSCGIFMGLGFWLWNLDKRISSRVFFQKKYVYIYIYTYISIYVYMYLYVSIYVYIYVYIHIYLYIYIYIYLQRPCLVFSWNSLAWRVPCISPTRLPRSGLPRLI